MGTVDTCHRLAPALCAPEAAPRVRLGAETHAQVTTTTGPGGAGWAGQAHSAQVGQAGGRTWQTRGPQVGPVTPAGREASAAGWRRGLTPVPHLRGERLPRGR